MLIQQASNVTQAHQPVRLTGDSAPEAVLAGSSNVPIPPSVVTAPPPEIKAAQLPSDAQLKSAVESANRAIKQTNNNLEFSVDTESNKIVVKLMDSDTGAVIKQFPSEEMLALSKAIGQMQEQFQQAGLTKPQNAQGLLLKQQA